MKYSKIFYLKFYTLLIFNIIAIPYSTYLALKGNGVFNQSSIIAKQSDNKKPESTQKPTEEIKESDKTDTTQQPADNLENTGYKEISPVVESKDPSGYIYLKEYTVENSNIKVKLSTNNGRTRAKVIIDKSLTQEVRFQVLATDIGKSEIKKEFIISEEYCSLTNKNQIVINYKDFRDVKLVQKK
jgi:hypothetical protein